MGKGLAWCKAGRALVLVAGALALVGCASGGRDAGEAASVPVLKGAPVEGREGYFRAGRFVYGPQPDAATLEAFKGEGTTTVINLRSNEEMADLITEEGLDEAAAWSASGVKYVHIPLGGDDGYSPEDVDAFAAAVESSQGPVLIHCLSGGRVRTMYQAYLVKHRGYSLREAEAVTATLGGTPTALEQLLGRDVEARVGGALPATTP